MNYLTNYNNTDIIKQYQPMIYKIVNSIYKKIDGDIYNDLIQSGYEALLNAINKYDSNKASLTTYLYTSVKRAMYRERNRQVSVVHCPINIKDYLPYLYRAERMYSDEDDIKAYIKKHASLTADRINQLLTCKKIEKSFSLDIPTANEYLRYNSCIDIFLDSKRLFTSLLKSNMLTNNEKYFLKRYYLDDMSTSTIAKELNITPKKVSNIRYRLISKLRTKLKKGFNYGLQQTVQ